jgi:sulfite reductase (NADPH) flavoprotein alpha-component
MLSESKIKELQNLLTGLSSQELTWASGYIAGLAGVSVQSNIIPSSKTAPKKITIAFGTETGNSKKLANKLASALKAQGYPNKVVGLDQYKTNDLPKEEYFFVITSTHGEGEPPAAAKKFYDHIHSEAKKLEKLKYSVLALGDSSYPQFCQTGVEIHDQLNKLDAKPIYPIATCDVDFDAVATEWIDGIIATLKSDTTSTVVAAPTVSKTVSTGKKFYDGTIATSINLNDTGSNKETYHVEITCEEEIDYTPGDALGIVPKNNATLVSKIIQLAGYKPEDEVTLTKKTGKLSELLTNDINLRFLSEKTLQAYASIVGENIPATRIDLEDLLKIYPLKNKEQFIEVLNVLPGISPRLYSISSSPQAHSGEIHITVSKNTFQTEKGQDYGLCSSYIGSLEEGTEVVFYISKNSMFKLPAEDKPIILIGPGTGIAPMRSFLAERDALGSSGKNWLFFGEQHFATDFLYQTEIQSYIETGHLTKFNAAFSRDQKEKIYVQDKLKDNSEEVYNWIQEGASIYISGTKDPMSIDVANAIKSIIAKEAKVSEEEANKIFDQLVEEERYLADVY